MKTMLPATLAAVVLLAAVPADAGPRNGRGNGNGQGAWTEDGFCPPGLRDRNPPCVPPGQVWRVDDEDDDEGDDDDGRRERDAAEAILREVARGADEAEDRDAAQALAIIGTLMGLALIERQARERDDEVAPVAPEPEPASTFSFSEVPSRPASIEARAALRDPLGDATDPGPTGALGPVAETFAPEPPVTAPAPSVPRIVPLGEPLPGPLPTPQEEAILSDVFRRAADEGATGY